MTNEPAACIDPTEISDEELLEYARGDTAGFATRHLERCPACRAEVREYARLEPLLRVRLDRRSCPESLTLGEYAMDILAPAERQTVAAHLVECPRCREEARGLGSFLVEPDPPSPAPGLIAGLRRLLAQPLAPLSPIAAGLRGGSSEESVTYAAEEVQVVVSVGRDARTGTSVIAGMLQPGAEPPSAATAALYTADTLLQTEEVDDLSAFLFSRLSPGTYRIELTLGDRLIVIDPIAVP
jgi:anti-sigma factor RsiW